MESSETAGSSTGVVQTPETVVPPPSSEEPAQETVPQHSPEEPAVGTSSGSFPIDLSTKKNTESTSSAGQGNVMGIENMLLSINASFTNVIQETNHCILET